jgi:hypothetical protein
MPALRGLMNLFQHFAEIMPLASSNVSCDATFRSGCDGRGGP